MPDDQTPRPDSTAVRVALWRAMHVQIDPPPHVLEDEVGLALAAPDAGWRQRPDMDVRGTRRFRAGVVARSRFVEDLLVEQLGHETRQYVILGAGLDTFAQRRSDIASRLQLFEIDRPGPQTWKRKRLIELGFGVPDRLRLVGVDFQGSDVWFQRLLAAGFDAHQPAVMAATGLSMYLGRDAITSTLRQAATLARGSVFAMSFVLPLELADPEERPAYEASLKGARASGTPFVSFFAPDEMLVLARKAGFRDVRHVSAADLTQRYFSGRPDGLRPGSEEILVATT
ncbi:MAG TPA: class I SAM-dependent methyltransferase [Steroidobacteraceae bacterium]|jgi:methyltransferase (TIGR00027 family)